jgi:polyisoprenoid-binding protein YceI
LGFNDIKSKKINVENSIVRWIGHKVTGQHEGTIKLKEGELKFNNNDLIGGTFVIDMSTINTTDLEGSSKNRLDEHLKNSDFFGVDKHKYATMSFVNVEEASSNNINTKSYNINADLTIKGITNKISFLINIYKNSATTSLKIDRTKFNIKYGSASFFDGLKDRAIYDKFDLDVRLNF